MVPMPAVIVLIVCKVAIAGPPDQNSEWTTAQNLKWATENAMMVCRRQEVQMMDTAESTGADQQGFSFHRCQRSAMLLGPQWDQQHRSSQYRFWRAACPTPVVNGSGEIVSWILPDCGHREYVRCEQDSFI